MELSLIEDSLTYTWVFGLPSAPQNVSTDKKIKKSVICRLPRFKFLCFELFPQFSENPLVFEFV